MLGQKAPDILSNLKRISDEAVSKNLGPIDSDDLKSCSSANQSENDEMNQIIEIQAL